MPVSVLSMLYCTLILPYYQYCNIVWASDYPTNLYKLYMLQKRAMFFQTNEQIHHHDTRGKSNMHLISHNTTMRSFSKRVQEPFLWNSLDPLIKQL